MYTLSLEIINKCNLNCTYCYLGEKKNTYMSLETAQKAIDIAVHEANKQHDRTLMVYFIGGEPLMAFNLMKDVVDYAKKKCQETNLICKFSTTINGTLVTDEVIDFFVENTFEVKVSLDGPEYVQNLNRRDYAGTGSFEKIMKNLPLLRKYEQETGNQISVASVVTSNNYQYYAESFQFLLDLGIKKLESGIDYYCSWSDEQIQGLREQIEKVFGLYKAHIQKNQEVIFPVWEQQTEFVKEIEKNHEKINTVYLMVTRKCNMNCDFCAISANDKLRPEKEFKLEDIQNKVIPFFQKNKPHKMILTGGEPLIKDQIVEIAKALRNGLTCPITLQSNGLAITEELTEQLKGYIDEIDFSTMHMFGTPEKEQQLIKHIEMCQQAGIKVVLTFIYEKTNEMDLYRLIDIAAKYDIDVLFNIVSSVGRAKENSEILTDMEHLDMNLKIVKYILNQGYEDKKIGGAFYQRVQVRNSCGGYGKVMAIFPEGDIYMCQCMEQNQVRMGNILSDEPQKILQELENLLKKDEIKRLFCAEYKEICKECDYRYICGGHCLASEEPYDYRCIFLKAVLNYVLFYYDSKANRRKNLEIYIEYMEEVKRRWEEEPN